jgi:hypothetical protein
MTFMTPREMKFLKSIQTIREVRLLRAEREMIRAIREHNMAKEEASIKEDALNQTTAEVATMMTELRQKYRQRSVGMKEFDGFLGGRDRGRTMIVDAKDFLTHAQAEEEKASAKLDESAKNKMLLAKQNEKMKWVIETNLVVQPE